MKKDTWRLADLAGKFAHFGKKPKQAFTVDELNEAGAEAWIDRKLGPDWVKRPGGR